MRLTQFSDYALRALLYLRVHEDRAVPLTEIARSYGISYHHLVKVAALLGELGLVTTVRGRAGGYRLAKSPADISLGWLIRRTEPDFHLVECFDRATDTCPITPACKLRSVLLEAQRSFLDVLDRYTLADLGADPRQRRRLVQLLADRHALSALDAAAVGGG
jgi:Rrf2 family transcriptional regulator, nitric oxide-sensitive transcriptional repressor